MRLSTMTWDQHVIQVVEVEAEEMKMGVNVKLKLVRFSISSCLLTIIQ